MKRPKKSKGYTEGDVAVVDEPFPIEEEIVQPVNIEKIAKARQVLLDNTKPEYKILINPKENELEQEVSDLMNIGWVCVGGASFSDKLGVWYQTLIKEYRL